MSLSKEKISVILATGLGSGYLPWAPGSWGSLVIAVLGWWLLGLPITWYLIVMGVLFFIGVLVAKTADKVLAGPGEKSHDNKKIVIDEWVGMMITLLPLFYFEMSWLNLGIGFLLFRIFDTVKFGLAKIADNSKNRWGVMLDDFFASLHAAIFFFIVLYLMRVLG